jgi:hypothetical protein
MAWAMDLMGGHMQYNPMTSPEYCPSPWVAVQMMDHVSQRVQRYGLHSCSRLLLTRHSCWLLGGAAVVDRSLRCSAAAAAGGWAAFRGGGRGGAAYEPWEGGQQGTG